MHCARGSGRADAGSARELLLALLENFICGAFSRASETAIPTRWLDAIKAGCCAEDYERARITQVGRLKSKDFSVENRPQLNPGRFVNDFLTDPRALVDLHFNVGLTHRYISMRSMRLKCPSGQFI
jgi:hypothetical protein